MRVSVGDYRGRTAVEGEASLRINPVKLSDAGVYWCVLRSGGVEVDEDSIRVTVLAGGRRRRSAPPGVFSSPPSSLPTSPERRSEVRGHSGSPAASRTSSRPGSSGSLHSSHSLPGSTPDLSRPNRSPSPSVAATRRAFERKVAAAGPGLRTPSPSPSPKRSSPTPGRGRAPSPGGSIAVRRIPSPGGSSFVVTSAQPYSPRRASWSPMSSQELTKSATSPRDAPPPLPTPPPDARKQLRPLRVPADNYSDAIEGHTALLRLSIVASKTPLTEVEWSKEKKWRGRTLVYERKGPSRVKSSSSGVLAGHATALVTLRVAHGNFRGRAFMDSDFEPHLRIQPCKFSDTGMYWCKVTSQGRVTLEENVHLTVDREGSPRSPRQTSPGRQKVSGSPRSGMSSARSESSLVDAARLQFEELALKSSSETKLNTSTSFGTPGSLKRDSYVKYQQALMRKEKKEETMQNCRDEDSSSDSSSESSGASDSTPDTVVAANGPVNAFREDSGYDSTQTSSTSGLLTTITQLKRQCIKGLGIEMLMKAYSIIDSGEDLENQLVNLMGRARFELYADKVWQLRFLEKSQLNNEANSDTIPL
ncbi:PREDICTED: serine/arginine repetitive matrix protein 2-like [Branchiostoma belcheri]|uniref:Serine/arginine repetitive matrix protein 2-like n=1 Tax=Branchiostoma belcheri TaxID=7741 RepID=A0A6P4YLV4_BRABE|nr:PREDICTED: serine/arginine repetitive matrix protein 2-like [Branchiostoma belcheri]